jgi:8-oxo-dGTP pyrophosphatase MutT (NUDIX family)
MNQSLKKYPKVCVKIVFRCGNSVLYYKTDQGIRDIPGGHIEFGETIADALKRELKEELNYEIDVSPKLLYAWTYISRDDQSHRVYIGYLLDLAKKIKFKSKEFGEALKFTWLNKKDIKKQKFLPEMKTLLLKAADFK